MALGKKTGGRVKGTPNKNNPIKNYLRTHSIGYFEPSIKVEDAELALTLQMPVGAVVSKFDMDCASLSPAERVDAETKLLNFYTPKMQQTAVDMNLTDDASRTIEERLSALAADNDN